MTSLGYVLTNWTTEFIKHSKEKKLQKKNKLRKNSLSNTISQPEALIPPLQCPKCPIQASEILSLVENAAKLRSETEELRAGLRSLEKKLSEARKVAKTSKTEHATLLEEHEKVQKELRSLTESLARQLEERDQAHSERIKLLEQVMNDKDCEWVKRNEALQKDLRKALRSSILDTDREQATMKALEQEITSLHTVIDMRTNEIHDLRNSNNELTTRLERQFWLESELGKAKQRIEEMGLIIQNKIQAERELLGMIENLQGELNQTRGEADHFRRELENRQYLHSNHQQQQQQQQKASSGGDPTVVLDVVEKMESVAWMLQLPPSNG